MHQDDHQHSRNSAPPESISHSSDEERLKPRFQDGFNIEAVGEDNPLRAIANYGYDWENWIGADGRLLWVNPAVERVTGYTQAECFDLSGFPLALIEDNDRERAARCFEGALNGTSGNDVEFRIRRKDGSSLWVAASWQPIIGTDGQLSGYRTSIRDISLRKSAEKELRENRRQLSTLLSNLPGMAYRCANTEDWPMEFVSDGCRDLTGYEPEDLVSGKVPYGQLIHPEDRELVWRSVQSGVRNQRSFQIQYRIINRTGAERWVWEQGRLVHLGGGLTALEGFITDVTARVVSEAALRGSEEQYRTLVDRSLQGLVILQGEAGRIVFANPVVESVTGFAVDELLAADSFDILLPQESRYLLPRYIARLRGEDEPSRYEAVLCRKDGSLLWADVAASRILFRGEPAVQLVLMDITARKHAELELWRRDAILQALGDVAETLLQIPELSEAIYSCLARLGRATQVDRICIYGRESGTESVYRCRCVWTTGDSEEGNDEDRRAADIPCDDSGFAPVFDLLAEGVPVHGGVEDVPAALRVRMVAEGVLSLAAVPIFVQRVFWGFVAFHSRDAGRGWSQAELDAVHAVAGTLGAAVERSEARQALQNSEAFWRSLVTNLSNIVFTLDLGGAITFINRPLPGEIPERMIGRSISDFLDCGRVTSVAEYTDQVLHSGRAVTWEVMRRETSGCSWYTITLGPVKGEEGIIGLTGVMTEVTAQRQAADDLRRSEEKFRNIVQSSPMGVHLYRLEPDGRLIFEGGNPAADQMLAVDNSRFIGKAIEEAFPPLASTEVPARYRQVARDGSTWRTDEIIYEDDQIRGAYEVVAFQTSQDRVAAMFLDVTERSRAARLLKESEARYRSLVEDQTELIMRWRPDGTRTYVNEHYCRFFGTTEEQALRVNILEVPTRDLSSMLREKTSRLSPATPVISNEQLEVMAGSRMAWVQWTDRGLFDDAGSLIEIHSVGRDVTQRHEAEEALRASEAAMRSIFRAAPVAIAVIRDRIIQRVNDHLCSMVGYDRTEIVGREASSLYASDEDWRGIEAFLEAQSEEIGFSSIETRLRCKDDEIIDVLMQMAPVDPKDPSAGITVAALDITERNRTHAALAESEERFRRAFRTSPDAVAITRVEDGVYIDVNEGFTSITGYVREELIGRSSLELGIWVDQTARDHMIRCLRDRGRMENLEMEFRRKDGSVLVGLMSASLMTLDGRPHILTITRNIQELKDTREALRREMERAQMYLDVAATLMMAFDPDTRILMINRKGADLIGLPEADLIGRVWVDEFVPKEDRDLVRGLFRKFVSGQMDGLDYYESYALTVAGDRRLIAWYLTGVRNPDGQIGGILASGIDITERRRMEEDLHRTHEQLEQEHEALQKKNIALREVLNQIEGEKEGVKRLVMDNIERDILPTLQRLRAMSGKPQAALFEVLEDGLDQISSEFASGLREQFRNLTPRQVQICRLIKNGYTSKEIAESIGTSLLTVHKHREAIRDKLGLKNRDINLNSYLQSL